MLIAARSHCRSKSTASTFSSVSSKSHSSSGVTALRASGPAAGE